MKKNKKLKAEYSYIEFFNIKQEEINLDTIDDYLETKRKNSNSLMGYRKKTIRSGNMLEIENYPIYKKPIKRGEGKNETTKAKEKLNHDHRIKHVTRLMHCNFNDTGIWITLGYSDDNLPKSEKEAKRNIENYVKRLRTYIKTNNKNPENDPMEDLKYIYVTEVSETGRVHHHMVLNFPDRDIAEQKWTKGGYPQARRLSPDKDFGLTGLAIYITKQSKKQSENENKKDQIEFKSQKTYGYSQNLEKPKIAISDTAITISKSKKIARSKELAMNTFKKMHPKHELLNIDVKFSEFLAGAYIYVRMRKE